MNIVDEFLHQPIPTELCHYTSLEGFEGMVSSGTIWASEVHSSRDQTEFTHARDIAMSYLQGLQPMDKHTELGITAAGQAVSDAFETGSLSPAKSEVFIASFSSAMDRKSQWIDYSNGGRGVAVIMDLRNVRPPIELKSAVTLAPCVYDTQEKQRLIEHALNHLIEVIRDGSHRADDIKWASETLRTWEMIDRFSQEPFDRKALNRKMKNDFESEVHQAIARLSVDLFRLASHCKHHGYFEEHEWRLALPHSKARPLIFSKVEYREPTRIPYIAHRISGQPKLPILRVLAGFACYELERIETALAVNGYSVRVSKSELPEMR